MINSTSEGLDTVQDYYDLIDSQNLLVGPNDGMVEWAFNFMDSVIFPEEGLKVANELIPYI